MQPKQIENTFEVVKVVKVEKSQIRKEVFASQPSQPPAPKRERGWMREEMPVIAAWIDQLRTQFPWVDEQIRRGMNGEPVFYACENGHEIGTKPEGTAVPTSEIRKAKP